MAAEVLREQGMVESASTTKRKKPKPRAPFEAAVRHDSNLISGSTWEIATKLVRYHLPVNDVADVTGVHLNGVMLIRKALATSNEIRPWMGRVGRPPRSLAYVFKSPDTHIILSAFTVVFLDAHRARGGGSTIHGKDLLAGMDFCKAHGVNLNEEGVTRRMYMMAQAVIGGEGEIATCKCCRNRYLRATKVLTDGQRGDCPFCRKAKAHLGEATKGTQAIEEF